MLSLFRSVTLSGPNVRITNFRAVRKRDWFLYLAILAVYRIWVLLSCQNGWVTKPVSEIRYPVTLHSWFCYLTEMAGRITGTYRIGIS